MFEYSCEVSLLKKPWNFLPKERDCVVKSEIGGEMQMKKLFFLVVVLFLMLPLASYGNDKDLSAKVDSLTKTVETLTEENRALKASISRYDKEIEALKKELDSLKLDYEFDAPLYPVRYELTEKSYAEFKTVLLELTRTFAEVYDVSDDELDAALALIEVYSTESLIEEFFGEELTFIEILSEGELSFNGDICDYEIRSGKLYIYDECIGTIDDDTLSFSVDDEDGMRITLNFYRSSPKSGEKISLLEKLEMMESKINATYAYCFY